MPHLEFFLIAESVAIDQSTNRLSIFNILEEIQGVPLPPGSPPALAGIPQLAAVSSWNIAPEDRGKQFEVRLRVYMPASETPVEFHALRFTAEQKRQRAIQLVMGCPVTGPGDLKFELLLDGEHKATHLVTAQIANAPPQADPQVPNQDATAAASV